MEVELMPEKKHLLKCHSNGYEGHKDVYGRIMIHKPSNTITTGCNNPSKGRFVTLGKTMV